MVNIKKMFCNGITAWYIDASDLYKHLKVKEPFNLWCEKIYEYNFDEYHDYMSWHIQEGDDPENWTFSDMSLSLEVAKFISMAEKTDEGIDVRQLIVDFERLMLNSSHGFETKTRSDIERHVELGKHYNKWMLEIINQEPVVSNSVTSDKPWI